MTTIEDGSRTMPLNTMSTARPLARPPARFDGRHMAAILVAFFGVVIVVNFVMASLASSTFTGVVVENSYVASQNYNRWLDEARAERQLGWQARAARVGDGHLVITLAGVPAGATVSADAWHPLGRAPDRVLHFTATTGATFRSVEVLPAQRWRIRIEVRADGHRWRTEDMVS